jgi:hypothetical protein
LDQIKKIIKWEFSLNSKLSLINKKDLLHKNNLNFANLNNITDLVSNIRFSKNNKFLLDFNDDSKKKIKDILSFLFLNDRFYLIKKKNLKIIFFLIIKKDFFKIFFFFKFNGNLKDYDFYYIKNIIYIKKEKYFKFNFFYNYKIIQIKRPKTIKQNLDSFF